MSNELDKIYANRLSSSSPPMQPDDNTAENIIFNIENRTIDSSGFQDIVIENDNICRTIRFRIERYFEEADRATKSVSIRYTNPSGQSDESFGSNRTTETDYITFDWLISNKATSISGDLKFDVLFYDDNGYRWHTKSTILIVEKGLAVTTITPKPSQDWIDSWRSEAGQYLFDYQRLENSVNNAIGILETSLPAITTAVEQCEIVATSVEQLKQETIFNANSAKVSETNAGVSMVAAETAKLEAEVASDNAKLAKCAAEASELAANESKVQSATSATIAKLAETNSKASEVASNIAKADSEVAQSAAALSELNAKASENAAKTSETNSNYHRLAATEQATISKSEADRAQKIVDNMQSDICEVRLKTELPTSGTSSILYIVYGDLRENNGSYRWNGSGYGRIEPVGSGDMLKSVYDTDGDGIIDNAEKVNGLTVQTAVPAGAKFTDTVYAHPSTHPASMITGLPTSLPANGGNADTVDGYHADGLTPFLGTRDAVFININNRGYSYICDIANGETIGLEAAWWHIIHLPHTNNNGYDAQIAMPLNNSGLLPKYRLAGGGAWTEWRKWNDCYTYTTTIGATASQNIGVTGILATDNPIIDVVLSGNSTTDLARLEAWGSVSRIATYNGGITVVCYEQAPTVAIPIQIKVVR